MARQTGAIVLSGRLSLLIRAWDVYIPTHFRRAVMMHDIIAEAIRQDCDRLLAVVAACASLTVCKLMLKRVIQLQHPRLRCLWMVAS